MPTAPFWEDTPDPWDQLILAGRPVPGISTVSGRAGRKVDTRSPPGGDGARIRDRGYDPAQLEVEVRVWTLEQLQDLTSLLETIHPRGANPSPPNSRRSTAAQRELDEAATEVGLDPRLGHDEKFLDRLGNLSRRAESERRRTAAAVARAPSRTPVDAVHPALSLLGIRSVYVTGVSVPELRQGQLVTTISLLEWTAAPTPAPRPATTSSTGQRQQTAFDLHRSGAAPAATPPARLGRS